MKSGQLPASPVSLPAPAAGRIEVAPLDGGGRSDGDDGAVARRRRAVPRLQDLDLGPAR